MTLLNSGRVYIDVGFVIFKISVRSDQGRKIIENTSIELRTWLTRFPSPGSVYARRRADNHKTPLVTNCGDRRISPWDSLIPERKPRLHIGAAAVILPIT